MEKVECDFCRGTGWEDCPMEYGGPCPPQCPACNGSQKVICTVCDGTGVVDEEQFEGITRIVVQPKRHCLDSFGC